MKIHVPIQPILEITALDECMDANFRHPYYFPGEFHPFWELVYVLDGKLQAASDENIYTLHKGDMILHKPMEFHRLWTIDNSDIHALIIGFSAGGELLTALESGAFVLSDRQKYDIESLLDDLNAFLPHDSPYLLQAMLLQWNEHIPQIHTFVNKLENFLISLVIHSMPMTRRTVSESTDAQTYRSIVTELNASVESWITTEELACKLHCSAAHINRVFSRHSDIGVHKYLLKLKIAAAIGLLRKGSSVSQISNQLGFSNQNYFSSVFKRETGFSPTEYTRCITDR